MDYEYTEPAAGSSVSSSTAISTADGAGVMMPTTMTTMGANGGVGAGREVLGGGGLVPGKKRKGAGSQALVMRELGKETAFSNMLSFDNPNLVEGKLVADDGTVLEQHGMSDFFSFLSDIPARVCFFYGVYVFWATGGGFWWWWWWVAHRGGERRI